MSAAAVMASPRSRPPPDQEPSPSLTRAAKLAAGHDHAEGTAHQSLAAIRGPRMAAAAGWSSPRPPRKRSACASPRGERSRDQARLSRGSDRWLETDRKTLARVREESEARREAEQDRPRPQPEPEEEPTTPAQPEAARERAEPAAEERDVAPPPSAAEPEPAPGEEPPAPPDPEAVRDSVKAEVAALEPLHDELIEVLEAIHEALTDREEKRQAGQAVTMAGIAKRQDMRRMEGDAAAESGGRVRSARRSAGRAKARLEREIEEARATLARIRGEGAGGERMLAPQLVTV